MMRLSASKTVLDYAPARRSRRRVLVILAAALCAVGLASAMTWMKTRPQRPTLPFLTGLTAVRASVTQPDQPPVPRGMELLLLSHTTLGEYVVVYGGPAPEEGKWLFLEVQCSEVWWELEDKYLGTQVLMAVNAWEIRGEKLIQSEERKWEGRVEIDFLLHDGPWTPLTGKIVGDHVVIPFVRGDKRIEVLVDSDGIVNPPPRQKAP
jgi:hypothetical protein